MNFKTSGHLYKTFNFSFSEKDFVFNFAWSAAAASSIHVKINSGQMWMALRNTKEICVR